MADFVRYRFKLAQPIDRDVHVLVLVRYECDDMDIGRSFVLTESGWREFQNWDMLGPDLPYISGLDATMQKGLEDTLARWEEKVRKEILEHPPTEHYCEHKQALCDLYEWARDADYEGSGDFGDLFERLPTLTENPTNYVKADDA